MCISPSPNEIYGPGSQEQNNPAETRRHSVPGSPSAVSQNHRRSVSKLFIEYDYSFSGADLLPGDDFFRTNIISNDMTALENKTLALDWTLPPLNEELENM